jgi:NAD(P)H-dependent flavin oxidoreductase YrpB (nitropropane dioxygenase family)
VRSHAADRRVQSGRGVDHDAISAHTQALPGLPLLAVGGIVDDATMAAALVLGADADAVWCDSRFLASQEAEAHDAYKDRVLSADVGDTAILSIYGPRVARSGHADDRQ